MEPVVVFLNLKPTLVETTARKNSPNHFPREPQSTHKRNIQRELQ